VRYETLITAFQLPLVTFSLPLNLSVWNLVAHLFRNWGIHQIVTPLKHDVTVLQKCKLLARGVPLVHCTFQFTVWMNCTVFRIVQMVRAPVYKFAFWKS